jgi:hypothetical protein
VAVPDEFEDSGFAGADGADHMAGGLGDDTYGVEDAGDVVVELPGGGIDKIILSGAALAIYVLPDHVENAFWFPLAVPEEGPFSTASGREVIGNELRNELQGNLGKDILRGEAGNDVLDGSDGANDLYGGLGDDVFVFHGEDRIFENPDEGTDTVRSAVDVELLADYVERLEAMSDSGITLKAMGSITILRAPAVTTPFLAFQATTCSTGARDSTHWLADSVTMPMSLSRIPGMSSSRTPSRVRTRFGFGERRSMRRMS